MNENLSRNRGAFAGALAVAMLAVAVRLPVALRESLWHDECLTREVALLPWGAWWAGFAETESSPPAYFFAARLCAGALDGSWSGFPPAWRLPLRLPSLLASALACVLLYHGARRHFGKAASWVAGLYLAVNPWLIWHGAEARPYALWVAALCGLLVATLDAARSPEGEELPEPPARLAIRWTAWAWLALATHYFAVLPLAVASAFWGARLIFAPGKTPARGRDWLVANAALLPILGALAWLLKLQASAGHTQYIEPAGLADLAKTFLVVMPFGLDAALFPEIRHFGEGMMVNLGALALWRVGLLAWEKVRGGVHPRLETGKADASDLLILAWFVLPPALLFAISKTLRPVYLYDRYPIMSLPAFALLLGVMAQWALSASLKLPAKPKDEDKRGWLARAAEGLPILGVFFQAPYNENKEAREADWATRAMALVAALGLFFCAGWQAVRYANPDRGTLRPDWVATSAKLAEAGLDPSRPVWAPDPLLALPLEHNGLAEGWTIISPEKKLKPTLQQSGSVGFVCRSDQLAEAEAIAPGVRSEVLFEAEGFVAGRLLAGPSGGR